MTQEESVERSGVGNRPPIHSMAWIWLALAVLVLSPGKSSGADTNYQVDSDQRGEALGSGVLVELIGQTHEQEELVFDVVDRFLSASLDLPSLTITFWPSRDHCDGTGGWHRNLGEIEVCIPKARMIAHEIAHAWEAHNLSDREREAYRRLWDAPTWNSGDYEWHERAMELAANTVAFAVLNDDPEPHAQILMYLCTFEALTGRPLPTRVSTPCPTIRHPGVGSGYE